NQLSILLRLLQLALHRLLHAYLVNQRLDLRTHLLVRLRQAAPDALRIVERAGAIAVVAEERASIEDTHALPQHQFLHRPLERVLAHARDVHAVVEGSAEELEGVAVEEREVAWAVRAVFARAHQPDEEAARPRPHLPDDDDHEQADEAREVALPGQRRDDAGNAERAEHRAEQPRGIDDAAAAPV